MIIENARRSPVFTNPYVVYEETEQCYLVMATSDKHDFDVCLKAYSTYDECYNYIRREFSV